MTQSQVKRIYVTIPRELLEEFNDFVPRAERSAVITELVADYVDSLVAEDERVARVEARREQVQMWVEKLRGTGRRAADLFLP